MSSALDGVKVLEVAAWTFVPAAGAVLADWGADVIKVEHPVMGDPQRGPASRWASSRAATSAVNYIIEQPNRGKRSIGLDISTDHGRALLYKLVEQSDVFLTSFLPDVRQQLKIDVEHIRAVNPNIVYARGTGQGTKGPDAGKGGYDGASYWARGGVADALTPGCAEYPIGGRPAFGDLAGGMTIAGGIAAALFQRERTGVGVRSSTCRCSAWRCGCCRPTWWRRGSTAVTRCRSSTARRRPTRSSASTGPRTTASSRSCCCRATGSGPSCASTSAGPSCITDERFADAACPLRPTAASSSSCSTRPSPAARSTSGRRRCRRMKGVWAPVQMPTELVDDPQVGGERLPPAVSRERHRLRPRRQPGADGRDADVLDAGARARPAHRGDPPRAGHRVGRDRRGQGIRRHPLSAP